MDMPSLSWGHVHFLCHRVGWWPARGTCSFFPRDMLIFRGKEWAYGGYVQASERGEGMSRATLGCLGQAWDMLILSGAARTHREDMSSLAKRRGPTREDMSIPLGHARTQGVYVRASVLAEGMSTGRGAIR